MAGGEQEVKGCRRTSNPSSIEPSLLTETHPYLPRGSAVRLNQKGKKIDFAGFDRNFHAMLDGLVRLGWLVFIDSFGLG